MNCYMFQYPVKPTSMTYDDSVVVKARFRANNQQVQLEVRLNTQSENYDRSKGEQIALNTDGAGARNCVYRPSSLIRLANVSDIYRTTNVCSQLLALKCLSL